MALPAPIQALYDRIKSYNGNAYDQTTNPVGFARGGNQMGVFIAMLRDFADFGSYVANAAQTVTDKAAEFQAAVNAIIAGPVSSVNGRSGAVMGLAELGSPAFTGNPTAPTAAVGDNDTSLATTAFVQREIQRRAFESNLHYGS